MIEHLKGREQALAAARMDRAGGGMDCPGLSPQRRFHPASVLPLLRCRRKRAHRFVKALVDAGCGVESDYLPVVNGGGKDVPDFEQGDLPGFGN